MAVLDQRRVGRFYDPTTGQFLTVDPLAASTRARYSYAAGNPLSWTDPAGLHEEMDGGGGGFPGMGEMGEGSGRGEGPGGDISGPGPASDPLSDNARAERNEIETAAEAAAGACPRIPGISLESIDDVMANPNLLSGKTPADIEPIIGKTPGWRVETLRRGSREGQGWVLRHYNARGYEDGPQIRWHPGGGHHGPGPYWRVVGPNGDIGGIIR